jgi:hypothetical protein
MSTNQRWETLEEFVEWYKANNFPIKPPFEDPVYVTDISYSFVLFREGQYQAELYLVRPNVSSPEHTHPGIENIIMVWGGDVSFTENGVLHDLSEHYTEPGPTGLNKLFGMTGPNLKGSSSHSLICANKGGAFLSLEKWPLDKKISSVTIAWDGDAVDSNHAKLIQEGK